MPLERRHNSLFGSSLQFKKAFVSVTVIPRSELSRQGPCHLSGQLAPSTKKPFYSFFFGLDVQLVINPLLLKSLSVKCHLYDPHEYIEYIYLSLTSSYYYHTIISYYYIVIPNCN